MKEYWQDGSGKAFPVQADETDLQSPDQIPGEGKGRTDPIKLSSNLHTGAVGCVPISQTNKINFINLKAIKKEKT